jgi:hypothetical protein
MDIIWYGSPAVHAASTDGSSEVLCSAHDAELSASYHDHADQVTCPDCLAVMSEFGDFKLG